MIGKPIRNERLVGAGIVFLASLTGCLPDMKTELQPQARPIDWTKPYIVVQPKTTRSIQGISEVDRKRYFSVSDPGGGFEKRVKDDAMYDYLVNDLEIAFGRALGVVKHSAKSLKEDPDRPGFADLTPLKKKKLKAPSERFVDDFGPNLNVAAHGSHNAFPEFMGRFETKESAKGDHPQYLPQNIAAAAELSAAVLRYNYSDFERPRYYELVNEPHWSFFKEQHLADWHLKTMERVHETTPDVKVGGLCMSVCYFYRGDYKSFNGLKNFIDFTGGRMDFYSFHTYDYHRWRDGEFKGRLQSGLPLEGTLDLVPNYTVNQFGKEMDMVVSEHGGYIGSKPKGEYDGELVAAEIMAEHHPDADPESWGYEMKKRSIVCFAHVSSILANTMAFMDHPHTVKKCVPFILVNTWSWDPKYYANLYVAYEYKDRSNWIETDMAIFYKFFRGVNGRRVKALCSDPDLQARAFVDDSKLYLAARITAVPTAPSVPSGKETETVFSAFKSAGFRLINLVVAYSLSTNRLAQSSSGTSRALLFKVTIAAWLASGGRVKPMRSCA